MYCVAAVVYYWILHALVDLLLVGLSVVLDLSASDWSVGLPVVLDLLPIC